MPDYSIESRYTGRIAGVDEAGRGPLAGPVVAAAVVFTRGVPAHLAALLDDSKKLSAVARENAYAALYACPDVEIGTGAASCAEIEQINILQAAMRAMARAVQRLPAPPHMALIDGTTRPPLSCDMLCVTGGDALCFSIAAASIIAKVLRDRAMARLHLRYPHYGWADNAGYGTQAHRRALHQHGISPHHRKSFGTVREILNPTDP